MAVVYANWRSWHRWLGLASLLFLLTSSVTGLGLLLKKRFDLLQPPTQRGVSADVEHFISIERAIESALGSGHPDFASADDIDRIDVRPGKGVFKVRSKRWSEVQVDATTGAVLSSGGRVSDVLEAIHDGSWFGAWVYDWVMPGYAVGLVVLSGTGLVVWYVPWKLRRQRARASGASAKPMER